ncbi:MAG: short-chain dehydrogenase [Candidatus Puniceispirillum sp.]|nr:short-chain dehydrogenase [Candidatus Puniceispirillum sp.]
MTYDNKVIFVSGANRGIGKAIVEALLKHNVQKVYAAARHLENLSFQDARVVPVQLDITNPVQVRNAAQLAQDTDILINNAGALAFAPIVAGKIDDIVSDMQVNFFGTVNMIQSFAPVIEKKGGGAIANLISIVGLAPMVGAAGYCASKSALFSATQAMRTELKPKHISVHGIFPGPIDTRMAKDFNFPKASADITAENIIGGIAAGHEDIFPDPMSKDLSQLWAKNPKDLEKQFATM